MFASKEEKHSLIRFFSLAKGVGIREVHRRMKAVYGEHALPLIRVQNWHKRFREGRYSGNDDM